MLRPCPTPGCPELVRSGRCPSHQMENQALDRRARGSAAERGYDWTWTKLRNRYLKAHPICEQCERQGKVSAGRVVDHVIPIAEGGARLDETNLQTLCLECHAAKTRRENRP